jgi:hypothetical protein
MSTSPFVNIVVAGPCKLTITGEAQVRADFDETPQLVSGEQQVLEVTRQANLSVAGQLFAIFTGPGAFLVDAPTRVRMFTNGSACVNMMSPTDFRVGGKGVAFVEGAHVVADDIDEVIAVDCPSVGVKDSGRATTIGCGRVEAFGTADLAAFGAESLFVVERARLRARDCREVTLGEGDGDNKPTVEHLVNCGTPQTIRYNPVEHAEAEGTISPVDAPPAGDGDADAEVGERVVVAEAHTADEHHSEPPARVPAS